MPLLDTLPTTIATSIHTVLPDLRQCEAYAGPFDISLLKSSSVRAPAVLVSIIKVKQAGSMNGPHHLFDADMAAYIVTGDSRDLDRDAAAAQIGQTLLNLVPDQTWGEACCGDARDVVLRTLVGKSVKAMRLGLWAVTWMQPIALGSLTPPDPMDIDLTINPVTNSGARP